MQQRQELESELPLQERGSDRAQKLAYYSGLFKKYDTDHDGYLNVRELISVVESREYEHDIPAHCVRRLYAAADSNRDRRLDLNEFIAMITDPDLKSLFGHYVNRYIRTVVVPPGIRGGGGIGVGLGGTTVPDGLYEQQYSCIPPPVGMPILSLLIILVFCIDEAADMEAAKFANGPIARLCIYDPARRDQVWRYISYMFVHVGVFHLCVNVLVQVLLGVPLEMVHRWWRVLLVYGAGVLAGSLGTSVVDPSVKLAGASGGVYALITANIATIIMNWREMSMPALQLFVYLLITGSDVGTAIYDRYVLDVNDHIGYTAHFCGALAGLLVGINVLRNLKVTRTERVVWWCSISVYALLMLVALVWNIAWPAYFPTPKSSAIF